jgi:hypothetical protein
MSKHTPGPWEITGHGSRPTPCTWVSLGPEDDGNSLKVVGADQEANARLIADAPAMLDALRGLLEPAESRWRALPKTSYEKKAIGAAQAILSRIDGGAA